MQIIHKADKAIEAILNKQKRKDGQYRLFNYVIQLHVDDGLLLYNVLTLCMVKLDKDEAKHILGVERLIDLWFLVPEKHDDKKLCNQVKQMVCLLQKKAQKGVITGYTILTTTDCNARCFYCYEKGRPRVPMSEETALQVSKYIQAHCYNKKVSISWFGGEPLYNSKVIDIITKELTTNGVQFKSTMVSNAYLFSEEIIKRAKTCWKLKKVQVTLDGTEHIYNKCKAYIHQDKSPYQRVLQNINLLLDEEIYVTIRLNVDKHNADNLIILVDELAKRFGKNKYLSIYSHILFEKSSPYPMHRTPVQRSELFEKRMELEQCIINHGYKGSRSLPKHMRLTYCMADSESTVVITPKGDLGKCEGFSEDHLYGNIVSSEINQNAIDFFKEHQIETSACNRCVYYPQCIRLEGCPNIETCVPDEQEENIYQLRWKMEQEYNNFLKNYDHHQ